eukprot:TRINITY_DN7637_c0_g1_i3.p1 TRINITY_DN7637_c0_g1~~TRINITY_DN7637_c0_g1_i3.p1  ORF type:complete len:251 (+),score=14.95 TRINITY_DN7637_c0_g1_i3:118-870(+)
MAESSEKYRSKLSSLPIKVERLIDPSAFVIPDTFKGYVKNVLISRGEIESRLEKLAWDVVNDYKDRPFLILVVLRGSFQTFSVLKDHICKFFASQRIKNRLEFEFIRVKSYVGTESSGQVMVTGLDKVNIEGREVLIVEDIIDTGLTLSKLQTLLAEKKPKSIQILTLLDKPAKRESTALELNIRYIGFEIPPYFVIGFGLDLEEEFRDLEHICVFDDSRLSEFVKSAQPHFRNVIHVVQEKAIVRQRQL